LHQGRLTLSKADICFEQYFRQLTFRDIGPRCPQEEILALLRIRQLNQGLLLELALQQLQNQSLSQNQSQNVERRKKVGGRWHLETQRLFRDRVLESENASVQSLSTDSRCRFFQQ